MMLGMILSGAIADSVGWQWIFYIYGRPTPLNVNVNVFSHLLSTAYKLTSGPLYFVSGNTS